MGETAHGDSSWLLENCSCGSQLGVTLCVRSPPNLPLKNTHTHTNTPHAHRLQRNFKFASWTDAQTVISKCPHKHTHTHAYKKPQPWPKGTSSVTWLQSNRLKHEWVIGVPALSAHWTKTSWDAHYFMRCKVNRWKHDDALGGRWVEGAVWNQSGGDSSALSHAIFASWFD